MAQEAEYSFADFVRAWLVARESEDPSYALDHYEALVTAFGADLRVPPDPSPPRPRWLECWLDAVTTALAEAREHWMDLICSLHRDLHPGLPDRVKLPVAAGPENRRPPAPAERPDRSEPRPVPPGLVLKLSASDHELWAKWVDGEIPGFPDDDGPLFDAQAAAATRIRADFG